MRRSRRGSGVPGWGGVEPEGEPRRAAGRRPAQSCASGIRRATDDRFAQGRTKLCYATIFVFMGSWH